LIPIQYESFVKQNYNRFINGKSFSDDVLQRYFDGCFRDMGRIVPLSKVWICLRCLGRGPSNLAIDSNYGWGDKPVKCEECGNPTYEVGTFQARSSYVGNTFEHACHYLLTTKFGITVRISGRQSRLYDLLVKNNVVIETKGGPRYVMNPDGSKSKIDRIGMERTDTEKKAFENASKWRKHFPNGYFYILTNAIPRQLREHHDDKITAIYNVTKERDMTKFADELKSL
jgi:hypothetical protein